MNKIKLAVILMMLGLSFVLVACRSRSNFPVITITPIAPKHQASQIVSTKTEMPIPSKTATITPTHLPETTPTKLPQTTKTVAALTATPSATSYLVATVLAASPAEIKESSNSPDGRWQAEVIRYECVLTSEDQETAYEVLRLGDRNTGKEQDIAEQIQNCGGVGAAGLGQISWSQNSRFLYFSTAAEGVPDGFCGNWQRPLTAYNMTNGEVFNLAQGPLAPNQQVMAFWQINLERKEAYIVIWDLENGEISRFPAVEPAWYDGPIVWSPNGTMLAYIETQDYCVPWGETVIALIDIARGKETILVKSEDPSFVGLQWIQPESISILDDNDQTWMFDLSLGELTQQP